MEQRVVAMPDDSAAAATDLREELALEVIAPGVLHKAYVGGVRLNVTVRARSVWRQRRWPRTQLCASGRPPTAFVMQRMALRGVEVLVGVVNFSSRPHGAFDVGSHLRSGPVAYGRRDARTPQDCHGSTGRLPVVWSGAMRRRSEAAGTSSQESAEIFVLPEG